MSAVVIVAAFYLGFAFGAWVNRKPPKIEANLTVTPELLVLIEQKQVMEWLEQRGLVWQPKGAVFDPERKVDK